MSKEASARPKMATSKKQQADPPLKAESFPVVGVGASAGGLETYTQLLKALPADTGMAFVLVQHLDPNHASLLTDLLHGTTKMPVIEAADGMPVEPNHVYVIPPNSNLAIFHGILHLMPRTETRGQHMPIDYFLLSLAEDQGSRAIGVILSGTASDGAQGLKAVKSEGGICFAQDPASAKYDGMPRAAIAAGAVDFVMPPGDIALELARIGRHPYLVRPQDAEAPPEAERNRLKKIFILLRASTGVDFTYYKQSTIKRRIARRMVLYKMEGLQDYLRYLQENPSETQALYEDILITVTAFFREPQAYDALKRTVFPSITRDKRTDEAVRIWVPGCSTGEEAYSIAVCLLEFMEGMSTKPLIQIFATDINETAIEKARQGIYAEAITADVSPGRLRRFFVKAESGYQITKQIRDMCVFARHDLTRDPPFSRLDFISCRNLLIYLGSELQKRVIPIFHYALKAQGYLLLGNSETVGKFADLFKIEDKKNKIYTRKAISTRAPFEFTPTEYALEEKGKNEHGKPDEAVPKVFDIQKETDRIVLSRYSPDGVVVSEDMEIVQFRGHTGPYLEHAPGKASLNLVDVARGGLGLELRTIIHKARQSNATVRKAGLRVAYDHEYRSVDIESIPVRAPSGEYYFLVLFKDVTEQKGPKAARPAAKKGADEPKAEEREIILLSKELAETKEYLRSIIEDKEAANEELRAANEEIQSSNEELQSINEELETAKEELQSSNEELTTVNDEMQNRNIELSTLNDDLSNVLASVNIPIIILGNDLRIRRFTSIAEKVLNIIPTDIGRPISDIKLKIDIPDLRQLVIEVIDSVSISEREVRDLDGRWYSLRVRPYKTEENKIDGAVISFINIDALKRSSLEITEARDYAQAIVETVRDSLLIMDKGLRVVSANRSFYRTFKVNPAETQNRLVYDLGDGQWDIPALRKIFDEILTKKKEVQDFEVEHDFLDIGHKVMLLNARQIIREQTGNNLILLAIKDITERKQAEVALKNSEERFRAAVDTATDAVISIDSKNKIVFWNQAASQMFAYQAKEAIGQDVTILLPERYRAAHRQGFAKYLATGESVIINKPIELEGLRKDGSEVPVGLSVATWKTNDRVFFTGIIRDITERKRAEEELRRSNAQVSNVLESITDAFFTLDTEWRFTYLNDQAVKLLRKKKKELMGGKIWDLFPDAVGSTFYLEYHKVMEAKVVAMFDEFYPPFDAWFEVHAYPYADGISVIFSDITERNLLKELSDTLNDINMIINSTLDFDDVMASVIEQAARVIESASAELVMHEDNMWVIKNVFGLPQEIIGMRLTDEEAKPTLLAVEAKKPIVINSAVRAKRISSELVEEFGIKSFLMVPLVLKNAIVGSLSFGSHSAGVFGDAQLDFTKKLAASISLAIENTRLFKVEQHIADTLQGALLSVPEKIEGIDFGYLYRSATEAARVGGDFYDIFELEDNRVGIVIGDVSGKGIEAATLTATVKSTIRAYAYRGDSPAAVMKGANYVVGKTSDHYVFVTTFFGVLEKSSGILTYCSAGHPPAIFKGKKTGTSFLGIGSPAVGAISNVNYIEDKLTLDQGDYLILYTDGVTEARHGSDFFGDKRLLKLVEDLKPETPRELADLIFNEVKEFSLGKLKDDVAVLAIKMGE